MSIIASSTTNELSGSSSFSSELSQYGNALSISHANMRPAGSVLLLSPTKGFPVSVSVSVSVSVAVAVAVAGARRRTARCGQKSRMVPLFMSNQRCPATTTEDEDEPVGASKQRVASAPQVSHGTAGGRLESDRDA